MSGIYDVIIIGAGPMGCKVGELLGKNHKILIIDKKSEIGKPVQCTGFVSDRIFKLSGVSKKVVLNKVTRAKFVSPNGNKFVLKSKRPFYTLDRELFDKEIAVKAEKNGAEIRMKTELKTFKREKDYLEINTNKGRLKTKLLVGADGPSSTVARIANLPPPDNLLVAVQETVKGDFDSDCCELWFGSNLCPGFFGWVAPEDDNWGRLGLATTRRAAYYLEKFIKKRTGGKTKTRDKVSGLMRYGLIKNSVADRVLLVGDAACHLKPFSGGGLLYGLIGTHIASKACESSLKQEKYDYEFLKKNYDYKWREKLRYPMLKGLWMNKIAYNSPDWLLDFGFGVGRYFESVIGELVDEDLL